MNPPGGWGTALTASLGIEPWRIPVVVFSALAIYLVFYLLIHLFGSRILTGANTFDAAVIIMLGAVAGRVVIGHPPTLAAGIIGLTTLVALEVIFGSLHTALARARRHRYLPQGLNASPIVVFAQGRRIEHYARRAHVTSTDIAGALRRAGVASSSEVLCVILEPNGSYSVIRRSDQPDPALFAGVQGAEYVIKNHEAQREEPST